jgi:hypothetical protein
MFFRGIDFNAMHRLASPRRELPYAVVLEPE